MKKAKLNIKTFDIDELLEAKAPYNPREISDESKSGLQTSINKFGYVENIIYNKQTKTLVSGHQRLDVLKEQGYEEVDVNVIDIDLESEKALNVAMNAKTITGDFTSGINELLEEILQHDVEVYDMMNLGSLGVYDEETMEEIKKPEDKHHLPEMDLMPYEHYDCILVVFTSVDDFTFMSSKLGLNEKRIISSPMVKNKKVGKVRAIDAQKIIELL